MTTPTAPTIEEMLVDLENTYDVLALEVGWVPDWKDTTRVGEIYKAIRSALLSHDEVVKERDGLRAEVVTLKQEISGNDSVHRLLLDEVERLATEASHHQHDAFYAEQRAEKAEAEVERLTPSCLTCFGSGKIQTHPTIICPKCGGTGKEWSVAWKARAEKAEAEVEAVKRDWERGNQALDVMRIRAEKAEAALESWKKEEAVWKETEAALSEWKDKANAIARENCEYQKQIRDLKAALVEQAPKVRVTREWVRRFIPCDCIDAYKDRGLEQPDCRYHNSSWEEMLNAIGVEVSVAPSTEEEKE